MRALFTDKNSKIFLQEEQGFGAESKVYGVLRNPQIVAKIYKNCIPLLEEKERKIQYMIQNCPEGSSQRPMEKKVGEKVEKVITIAWPINLLYDEEGFFVGYTMPKIEYDMKLGRFCHPSARNKAINHRQVAIVARNLAMVFAGLHSVGCQICDSNEENFLIDKNGFVILIDTDSFQIKTDLGKTFEAECLKPENSPPEYLSGTKFKFTEYGDRFVLAVLIFRLLMEGYHPFCGRPLSGSGLTSTQDLEQVCIKKGWFPYENNLYIQPPMGGPEYIAYPLIREAFHDCFIGGHTDIGRRPSAIKWVNILGKYIDSGEVNAVQGIVTKQQSSEKVCPFIMVLDVTPSLTEYYDDLQNGYNRLIEQLKKSDASSRIEFCLVEFADPPELIIDFESVDKVKVHKIRLRGGYTRIGEAVIMAMDAFERRRMYYWKNSISFCKPNVVLFTDGMPSGNIEVNKTIPDAIARSRNFNLHCVSVGKLPYDASIKQRKILKKLSTVGIVHKLKETEDFKEFFSWLSASVTRGNLNSLNYFKA